MHMFSNKNRNMKRKQAMIAIQVKTHERLKEMASDNYRTISGMINYLVDKEWNERENKGNIIKNNK